MKLSRKTLCSIIAVLLIAVSNLARSSEVPNPDDGSTLNADLNHLISILEVNETDSDLTTTSQSTAQDHSASPSTAQSSLQPTKTVIYKKIKYRKIRKPVSTSSPVLQSTTPTFLPPQTSSSEPLSTSTTSTSTTTEIPSTTTTEPPTTPTPPVDVTNSIINVSNFPNQNDFADRREDVNVDDIAPPSQIELAQQLSLLNSLLTSLNDNATATTSGTTPSIASAPATESLPNQQSISQNEAQAVANNQTLAILNSIFGGRGISPVGISNEDATAAVLGFKSQGSPSSSNVATRQIPIASGTEGAKALSEFLLQAAAIEAVQKGNNDNFQNVNANLNSAASAAAANNQISSLVSILGTLNAISPQGQNAQNLLGSGQFQGFQQSQILDPQQQVLAAQQQRDQTGAPNQLTDLLSQFPQHQHQGGGVGQSFDIRNILGQGALGGGGILSTIGSGITSLGSSMITTFSNLLSGSGIGGKPRVRGVDTRLGLGYRFGDAADAQLMWDVGPQLFTEPMKNEQRTPTMTKKSHTVSADQDETDKFIQSLIGGNKPSELKGFPAAKRVLNLQSQQNSPASNKPFSLLEMWNAGKEPKSKQALATPTPINKLQIPHQLLTPPVALALNEADRVQMARNKSFKKRSSAVQLKNYYSKPDDNPLAGHSTLTAYEQMLITRGKILGAAKFRDIVGQEPTPTTRRSITRRKRPQPTSKVSEKQQDVDNQEEQLPTVEYGNNAGLSGSTASKKQKKKRGKPSKGKKKKKRPSSMRPRPVNDKHKWKPRRVVEEDLDSQQGESQRVQKPLKLNRDEHRSSKSMEYIEPRKRTQKKENKIHEKDHSSHDHTHNDHEGHKTPCSKHRELEDKRKDYKNTDDDVSSRLEEPESSHSLAKPQFNDNQDTELDDDFRTQPETNDDEDEEEYDDQTPTDTPQDETQDDEEKRRPTSSREKYYTTKKKPHNQDSYYDSKDVFFKNSREKSKERPTYGDGIKEYNERPRHKDNFRDLDNNTKERDRYRGKSHKHSPTPKEPQISKSRRKTPPKFSLTRIFNYWMGGRGRRSQKVKKINQHQPSRERGQKDETSRQRNEDNDYERFAFKKPHLSRSEDPFRVRNRRIRPTRRRRPSISAFNHKISRITTPLKRGGSSPYDFMQTYSPEDNPEANDSFLRRNQVSLNNRLKKTEKQKLIQSQSPESPDEFPSDPSSTPPEKAQPSSVMSFVKNYFASKTPKHSPSYKKKTHRPPSGNPSSISTLAKLISNPSALNPLKMLPIRRNRVRQGQSQTTPLPQVRHKLAVVNGKLQILNITGTPTTTTTESPIIHIGDDMSFEELTEVLGAVKKKRKQKLKLRTTTTTPRPKLESKKDYEYEDEEGISEETDFVVKAEKKVDNDVAEDDDANDGLKGIFIDIESGEVMALKPVAELTSFQPPKEEEAPTLQEVMGDVDELDDEDGDGVADKEIQRKDEIFSGIQSELKKNYDSMKKAHEKLEAKKRRKEAFVAKGMDESMDVVSKYFDMVQEEDEGGK